MQAEFLHHYFSNSPFKACPDSPIECPLCSKGYVNFRKIVLTLGVLLFLLILILYQLSLFGFNANVRQTYGIQTQNKTLTNLTTGPESHVTSGNFKMIPNIVHFVYLTELGPRPRFDFPFHQFIAIYSAHYYLKPERIFIHTNVHSDDIQQALNHSTSWYTQAVEKLPTIEFRYHGVTNKTSKGLHLEKLAHQSDFVRTDVLRRYGGIYLDDDAYILRDLSPLRHSGFSNVVGIQDNGAICNAVILAEPHSELVTAYHSLQDDIFDGSWDRHSVALLATLATKFAEVEQQVLVLPQDAFFPFSWNWNDLHKIYDVHEDDGNDEDNGKGIEDSSAFTEYFNHRVSDTWRRDWRTSYILHGWTSAIGDNFKTREKKMTVFGQYGGITLDYVLARNSNFARAVYPAVRDALDKGVLNHVRYDYGDGRTWP